MRSAIFVFMALALPIVSGLVFALYWRPRRPERQFRTGALLNRFMVSVRPPVRQGPDSGGAWSAGAKVGKDMSR